MLICIIGVKNREMIPGIHHQQINLNDNSLAFSAETRITFLDYISGLVA